jgi:aryl-alcohol dehydrogenase-like predicted oxidoreductase
MVSEIALGSWHTFGTAVDQTQSTKCIRRALDEGINLIDTANVYGKGAAESVIGEALVGVRRESYLLATKLFFPMNSEDQGLSRFQILKQVDLSLKRLRTTYIDLYQCHRYDENTPLEETMQGLNEVVQSGKVRYIGFSEWPIGRIRAALKIPNVQSFVSSQPQYSMLWRHPEVELFPLTKQHKISNLVWSPLAQGGLTGKYLPDQPLPSDSRASHEYSGKDFEAWILQTEVLTAIQDLKSCAERQGMTVAQLALAWILRRPEVAAAIVGVTSPHQVSENARASGRSLDSAALERIERTLAPITRKPL